MKILTVKMVSLLMALTFFKNIYVLVQNLYDASASGTARVVADTRSFENYADTFKGYIYRDSNYKLDMYFRIFLPEGYDNSKQYPVIVYLHGSGERGDDNNRQLSNEWFDALAKSVMDGEETNPCILVAPQCLPDHDWSDGALKEQNILAQVKDLIVKGIEKNYSVDTNRLYLTGFSMGGIGTWSLLGKYPGLFAAAAPVSGAGNPLSAFMFNDVPIWAAHSLFDTSVPSIGSIAMVEALKAIDGNIQLTLYEYINYGHIDAPVEFYSTPELYSWLFAQSR